MTTSELVARTEPIVQPRDWVVWSHEHDAWWASNRRGYVTQLLVAGLYTEAEAKEIERGANQFCGDKPKESARPLDEVIAEQTSWRLGPMVADLLVTT